MPKGSHWAVRRAQRGNAPLCACGCGEAVRWNSTRKAWSRFAGRGHHGRLAEQKPLIGAFGKLPKSEETRRKMAEARNRYWASGDRSEHKERVREIARRYLASEAAQTPEAVEKRREVARYMVRVKMAKPAVELADIYRRVSSKVKAAILDGRLIPGTSLKRRQVIELDSGRCISVDSTWEAGLAEHLDRLGIAFNRAVSIDLGSMTWTPDFVASFCPEGPVLLEVKGHPKAIDRWAGVIAPALRQMGFSVPIYLFTSDPRASLPTSPSELLSLADVVIVGGVPQQKAA